RHCDPILQDGIDNALVGIRAAFSRDQNEKDGAQQDNERREERPGRGMRRFPNLFRWDQVLITGRLLESYLDRTTYFKFRDRPRSLPFVERRPALSKKFR